MNETLLGFGLALLPLSFIAHGLVSGRIVTRGYENWRPQRASRTDEPWKFWAWVVYYLILFGLFVYIGLRGS